MRSLPHSDHVEIAVLLHVADNWPHLIHIGSIQQQLFVECHFPPEPKARAVKFIFRAQILPFVQNFPAVYLIDLLVIQADMRYTSFFMRITI